MSAIPWLGLRRPTRIRTWSLSLSVGILAALAMLGVYLLVLSLLQSPEHALEQMVTDRLWVGLVALGFGSQVGLYAHLRLVLRAATATGASAVTGTGTGTSTLGMLACCAHHLSDIAPLVALTGAGSLSGVIGFFADYKYAFVGLGLAMNALGIVVTIRTLRRVTAHGESPLKAPTLSAVEGPACH